ncbi:hypothetical protein [Rhizobium etli]|uniref:hypothetical protein n=1 Tax=Rhizobium etli TaxID=29449 RepID=UPI000589F8A9|nr:hypothetical protein [Rhizobium sp. IE4771]
MAVTSLVPDALYWARSSKYFDGKITVVQVSTIFGAKPGYWTLALLGTDQHAMPDDFEFIVPAEHPAKYPLRHAAE